MTHQIISLLVLLLVSEGERESDEESEKEERTHSERRFGEKWREERRLYTGGERQFGQEKERREHVDLMEREKGEELSSTRRENNNSAKSYRGN